MKTNFHTHTTRCNHAGGTDREYIEAAIKNGLTTLGFSDHAPYPDNRHGLRMNYDQLEEYKNTISTLKHHYHDQIKIRVGLEIEYDPRMHNYYETLLQSGFEYLALGQHIFVTQDSSFKNVYLLTNTEEYIEYANSVAAALASGYFSFLAHPDVMFVNGFAWDKHCDAACDIILDAARRHNAVLEFNANGLRRADVAYPNKKFWSRVGDLRVIINSDAHSPDAVYDSFVEKAQALAKELNLNVVDDYI